MEEKLKTLCELITKEQIERLIEQGLDCETNKIQARAKYIIKKKYSYINIGSSGRYMVDNQTSCIYGIKAYGVINKNHRYGNLETINNYYWGTYTATLKTT